MLSAIISNEILIEMEDLNTKLTELKSMLSDAMITQIDLDLKIKLVCKLNEALSISNVVGRSEQLECDCTQPPFKYNELGICKYCGKQKKEAL